MPRYDYVCNECGNLWEETHPASKVARECPECESPNIRKSLTSVPTIAGGVATHAGDGKRASKEQLTAKWAEETPKLRKKLADKLGEDTVAKLPTLNHNYDV